MSIRILLVEDQTLMRQGLKTILDLEPCLSVVGEAATGEEGVRQAPALRPDVILLDVQMPGISGVTARAQISGPWPDARLPPRTWHLPRVSCSPTRPRPASPSMHWPPTWPRTRTLP